MRWKLNAGLRPVLAVAGVLVGMVVAPATAQTPELAMLGGLRNGGWEIKIRGAAGQPTKLCLRNGRELIQIRHRTQACNRVVVDDKPNSVTVHYSCPGSGYGQTTIRKENAQLVQISTQGVEGKAPFNFNAEGRYSGSC